MDVAVCIKQVPAAGEPHFDPVTRRLDRTSGPNVVNPFDRRAIALAVDLTRRFGGTSVALTLGPPQAREVLVEALASGIDRAVHLCDPAFAGSDTLATARALAAAIERLRCDLVLCGKYAVDGETGQVGPEVAALLGWPQVTGARRLELTPAATGEVAVAAERESDEGYEHVTATLPLLVTTAERLIQPIRLDADALERAASRPIEIWTAAMLDLEPARVGQRGSPTVVLELRTQPVGRGAVRLHDGPIEAQAEALADLISAWRDRAPAGERRRPLPTSPPLANDAAAVWVVAERRVDGGPTAATLELCGEAAWLARRLGGYAGALVLDAELATPEILAAHGVDRVLHLRAPALASYAAEPYAAALAAWLGARPRPYAVLFSASQRGREVAGRLAATLDLGLTGDCIGLTLDADGRLLQLKPALGLGVVAPIWSRTTPQLATVRPGSVPLPAADLRRALHLERMEIALGERRATRLRESVVETDPRWGRLEAAPAVVGVGAGIGGPEALPLVARFAALCDAAVGATRRVTDRGWLPRLTQIGLTGRIVAPDLYVAVGVRGAPNHSIGVRAARTIVALNSDRAAEIFRAADVGFVADFRPLLERTCALLEARARP
jgi:electron transfer flavoprotein alpha subunit